jgi:hypothetical protein
MEEFFMKPFGYSALMAIGLHLYALQAKMVDSLGDLNYRALH